jgi:hypothetical protein
MDQDADRGRVDQAGAGEFGVDQDLVEFDRLQEIARTKRRQWEAATAAEATVEQQETLLAQVLASTAELVNHEAGIPQRRREAQGRVVARRWRRRAGPGLVVLLVMVVGTVFAPWLSVWWALLPALVGVGCGLVLGGTEQIATEVDAAVGRAVEVLVVIAVVAATATIVLVPLVPALVLVVGSIVAVLSAAVVAAVWFGAFATPAGEGQ